MATCASKTGRRPEDAPKTDHARPPGLTSRLPAHTLDARPRPSTVPAASLAWVQVAPNQTLADVTSAQGAELVSSSDDAEQDYAHPLDHQQRHLDDEILVGRVYHTGAEYVFEESPFTLIPGSVLNGNVISIPWGHTEYKYDSFEVLTVRVANGSRTNIDSADGSRTNSDSADGSRSNNVSLNGPRSNSESVNGLKSNGESLNNSKSNGESLSNSKSNSESLNNSKSDSESLNNSRSNDAIGSQTNSGGARRNSSSSNGFHWQRCRNGAVPRFAVKGGLSEGGELLYIGRNAEALVDGESAFGDRFPAQSPPQRLVGKVHPSHGCLYVAFRGVEYLYHDYEVLTLNQSPALLQMLCRNCVVRTCLLNQPFVHVRDFDRLPLPPTLKDFCRLSLEACPNRRLKTSDDEAPEEETLTEMTELIEMNSICERLRPRGSRDDQDSNDEDSNSDESEGDQDTDEDTSVGSNASSKQPGGVWETQFFPSILWKPG